MPVVKGTETLIEVEFVAGVVVTLFHVVEVKSVFDCSFRLAKATGHDKTMFPLDAAMESGAWGWVRNWLKSPVMTV